MNLIDEYRTAIWIKTGMEPVYLSQETKLNPQDMRSEIDSPA